MNLLTETIAALKESGKSPADVRWVGHRKPYYLIGKPRNELPFGTWDEFARHADFEYDEGYGVVEISAWLVVVGDDWWLERSEYDGSEWWEFKTLPMPPIKRLQLRAEDMRDP